MKSARNEWIASTSEVAKANWADKYAPLLLETWNNPIWVEGRTQALLEVEEQIEDINEGNEVDKLVTPGILHYQNAMKLIRANIRVLHGSVSEAGKSPEELAEIAMSRIFGALTEFMDYDAETNTLSFEIVMVE